MVKSVFNLIIAIVLFLFGILFSSNVFPLNIAIFYFVVICTMLFGSLCLFYEAGKQSMKIYPVLYGMVLAILCGFIAKIYVLQLYFPNIFK